MSVEALENEATVMDHNAFWVCVQVNQVKLIKRKDFPSSIMIISEKFLQYN